MEEHKLLDILIHFRTLIITSEKINKLDPTVNFTDSILSKKQVFLNKLLCLLNETESLHNDDDDDDDDGNEIEPTVDIGLNLNSIANLLGGEQIIESGDINPAAFDNFGSGLARLLGGGVAPQPQPPQQIQIQLPVNQNLKENFTFSLKKKMKF